LSSHVDSKRRALHQVARATKYKDAAGLGALAYAYSEGDESTLEVACDRSALKIVAHAIQRPVDFFRWVSRECSSESGRDVVKTAELYLAAATWPWDKACIIAGALLAATKGVPAVLPGKCFDEKFPYWVALDKHTEIGKSVIRDVAKVLGVTYRQLMWTSFYCESTRVNSLDPSPWFESEASWRLNRAGLTIASANELWCKGQSLVTQRLETEAAALEICVAGNDGNQREPFQSTLL
jgi:hypothetical protein